ncbi:MAG: rod shape-determining protein MreD [Chlorobi bacterium]|nr:rod shape-determining protein MreD [Chlorobiota bacterium]
MINRLPGYIFIYFILVFLQVLVFNNIQFSGYVNPYVYILFIFMLPFETPGYLLLLLAFILGLTIDIFSNTPGMHSFATVFMAFIRPSLLRAIAPRDDYQPGTLPTIHDYGAGWYFKYSVVLILVHHTVLFFIEVYDFSYFFSTIWRILASSVFTLIFVFIAQLFVFRKEKRR